jgi:hypothetical protein
MINLKTSNGEITMPNHFLKYSKVLSNMCSCVFDSADASADAGADADVDITVNCTNEDMIILINWMELLETERVIDLNTASKKDIAYKDSFDRLKTKFIMDNHSPIFSTMIAANFLEIESFLELSVDYVASMLDGQTPAQLRSYFGVKQDMTDEEQERTNAECASFGLD